MLYSCNKDILIIKTCHQNSHTHKRRSPDCDYSIKKYTIYILYICVCEVFVGLHFALSQQTKKYIKNIYIKVSIAASVTCVSRCNCETLAAKVLLPTPTVKSVNSTIPSHCHRERWGPNLYLTLDPNQCQSVLELEELRLFQYSYCQNKYFFIVPRFGLLALNFPHV